LNSKVHKENIEIAKKTKLETENIAKPSNVATFKRPCSPSENTSVNKKIKGILKNSTQTVSQTNSNLPEDFFDDKMEQTNGASAPIQKLENKNSIVNTNVDVQDVEVEEEKEKEKETETEKGKETQKEKAKDPNPAALPEGFFDDPVMDAKVNQTEMNKI